MTATFAAAGVNRQIPAGKHALPDPLLGSVRPLAAQVIRQKDGTTAQVRAAEPKPCAETVQTQGPLDMSGYIMGVFESVFVRPLTP